MFIFVMTYAGVFTCVLGAGNVPSSGGMAGGPPPSGGGQGGPPSSGDLGPPRGQNETTIVGSASMDDAIQLHKALLSNYTKDIRPLKNQNEPIEILFLFILESIVDLDEVTGQLSFVGVTDLKWTDESILWNPDEYGLIKSVTISSGQVWTPVIVLLNDARTTNNLVKPWHLITYNNQGASGLRAGNMFKTLCDADVTYYPFDIHTCLVSFGIYGYSEAEAKLVPAGILTDELQPHSSWEVSQTKLNASTRGFLKVYITLKRKPAFTVINVISPIAFLGFLNVLVFLLPSESGERVSYSVTVLLALAVFMTITGEILPKCSDPIPIITYKLMSDIIISVLITVCVILNLSLYHKHENIEVPLYLQTIYRQLHIARIPIRLKRSVKVADLKVSATNTSYDRNSTEGVTDNARPKSALVNVKEFQEEKENKAVTDGDDCPGRDEGRSQEQINWKQICGMIDTIFLVVFTAATVLSLILFMYVTSHHKNDMDEDYPTGNVM